MESCWLSPPFRSPLSKRRDNDAILRETIDTGSPYYYPAIYMRYMSGDTTLTLEDHRHLYYGYALAAGL